MTDQREGDQATGGRPADLQRRVAELEAANAALRSRTAQLEATARRLDALVRAGLALTSPQALDEILHAVVEAAPRFVGGRSAILRLLRPDGHLEIRATFGVSEAYVAEVRSGTAPSPLAHAALRERRIQVADDLEGRPELGPRQLPLLREGVRAVAVIPVARLDRTFGVLIVHVATPHRFSEDELSALTLLAEQTAIALDHERLLRESQVRGERLAAQAQELDTYAYTVSHDLKAPLRSMQGYAQALQDDYGDRLDATATRYLGQIQAAAQRLGALIDDLLRYSRLERREMARQPVRLRPMLEAMSPEFENEVRVKGLTIRVELTVEVVEAEREGLREALVNLVGNAVKFSRPGGTILVASRREDDRIVLSVTDTGVGFDMKYHDRIFRIFERLHRQEEYPGTGVGLAIVRKVAERHGGQAWAVSEPGKGSTFSLSLSGSVATDERDSSPADEGRVEPPP